MKPKDRLVFALDVDDMDTARKLVGELAPFVGTFKVGPILYLKHGRAVVDLIHERGGSVFLDMKFHDIPETVAGASREAMRLGVHMFTVHALGGAAMIGRAAGELSRMTLVPGRPRPLCLAVTMLTSHSQADLAAIGLGGPLVDNTVRLAKLALASGATGLVTSAHELSGLRAALPPETIYVCPGIRGPDDPAGDQARVMSAREAVDAGATHLVVGRPIRDAKSPRAAAERILESLA